MIRSYHFHCLATFVAYLRQTPCQWFSRPFGGKGLFAVVLSHSIVLVVIENQQIYRPLEWRIQTFRYGGGGSVIQTVRQRGPPVSKNNFFRPFGPHFGLKIRGGSDPLGPSPESATALDSETSTSTSKRFSQYWVSACVLSNLISAGKHDCARHSTTCFSENVWCYQFPASRGLSRGDKNERKVSLFSHFCLVVRDLC